MSKERHPSEEELLALLSEAPGDKENGEARAAREAHVRECALCTKRLEAFRTAKEQHEQIKGSPRLHGYEPKRDLREEFVRVARQRREEDAAAPALIADVITGPREWWSNRARQNPAVLTVGFVQKLTEHSIALMDQSPEDAVEAVHVAVEVAERLRVDAYPSDLVIGTRADAWREYAYSLFYIGRLNDALEALDRAEQMSAQLPDARYMLARTALIRAVVYQATDHVEEGIELAEEAGARLREHGDELRFIKARIIEANLRHRSGDIKGALAIWLSLAYEPQLEGDPALPVVLHNIGHAYRDIGDFENARMYLDRAFERYSALRMTVETIRTRWVQGELHVMKGEIAEGLALLRTVWRDFESHGMELEAALVALEIAEALLSIGDSEGVPVICRTILDRFVREGMTSRAITAVAFLREAAAANQATPSLVRHVRDFLRATPTDPSRPFVAPPL